MNENKIKLYYILMYVITLTSTMLIVFGFILFGTTFENNIIQIIFIFSSIPVGLVNAISWFVFFGLKITRLEQINRDLQIFEEMRKEREQNN